MAGVVPGSGEAMTDKITLKNGEVFELEWRGFSKPYGSFVAVQETKNGTALWMTDGHGNWALEIGSVIHRGIDGQFPKEIQSYFEKKIKGQKDV